MSADASLDKYRLYHDVKEITWTIYQHAWDLTATAVEEQMVRAPRILTPGEALTIMDLSTKPGWPWMHRYPTKEKYFFSDDFLKFFPKYWEGCLWVSPPTCSTHFS